MNNLHRKLNSKAQFWLIYLFEGKFQLAYGLSLSKNKQVLMSDQQEIVLNT